MRAVSKELVGHSHFGLSVELSCYEFYLSSTPETIVFVVADLSSTPETIVCVADLSSSPETIVLTGLSEDLSSVGGISIRASIVPGISAVGTGRAVAGLTTPSIVGELFALPEFTALANVLTALVRLLSPLAAHRSRHLDILDEVPSRLAVGTGRAVALATTPAFEGEGFALEHLVALAHQVTGLVHAFFPESALLAALGLGSCNFLRFLVSSSLLSGSLVSLFLVSSSLLFGSLVSLFLVSSSLCLSGLLFLRLLIGSGLCLSGSLFLSLLIGSSLLLGSLLLGSLFLGFFVSSSLCLLGSLFLRLLIGGSLFLSGLLFRSLFGSLLLSGSLLFLFGLLFGSLFGLLFGILFSLLLDLSVV